MRRENLSRSLRASDDYYARMFAPQHSTAEQIRIAQKHLLIRFYEEAAEVATRLRALESKFGYSYHPNQKRTLSYSFKDDAGIGDDADVEGNNGNDGGGHYNPDEPRIPAGELHGGEWTAGAGTQDSGLVMDDAGNIYSADLPKPEGILEDWMARPANKGVGIKYTDTNNYGNEVRVMQGDPGSKYPVSQKSYVRWMNNGQWLDKAGNVTTNIEEAHIPLNDFEFLPEIFP